MLPVQPTLFLGRRAVRELTSHRPLCKLGSRSAERGTAASERRRQVRPAAARLDRRWARCVRRACTAPPYSVWRRLLCAAHRGRHSRTPKPAHCQHVASTPGIGHRLRCCTCSRLLTEPRRGGPRRCSRRRSRRLAQPPPPSVPPRWSSSATRGGCRWPHAWGARHGAPPRVEASAACMPGNAGAGVAEPGRRLRAGTSPWRSCRPRPTRAKFAGGIDKMRCKY